MDMIVTSIARFERDGVIVNTLFFSGEDGRPVGFETRVTGGNHDKFLRKYATRDEALKGHKEIITMVTTKQA